MFVIDWKRKNTCGSRNPRNSQVLVARIPGKGFESRNDVAAQFCGKVNAGLQKAITEDKVFQAWLLFSSSSCHLA